MISFAELRKQCEEAWGMSLEESLMQSESIEYHLNHPMTGPLVEGYPWKVSEITRWYKCIQRYGYIPNEYVEL